MDPTYLGQPAPVPTAQRPTGLMTKKTLFIILGLIAALVVGMIMLFSSGDQSGALQQRLSARQATTLRIIDDGQKNLSGDELKKLNSELKLILLGDTNQLEAALAIAGMKKVSKEVTAAEADAASFDKLKDAKLNAQYDTVYLGILTQKLESLRALASEVHDKTTSKSLKAALATEYKHLTIYTNALTKSD